MKEQTYTRKVQIASARGGIYDGRTPFVLSGRCRALVLGIAAISALLVLGGCNGGSSGASAVTPAPVTPAALLACDNSMIAAFKPDANTTVTLVKAFKKGDSLALSGTPAAPAPPVAANDLCMVKLNVGPGNPGPAGAPSTSAGIGVEVWLPSPANWNNKIHVFGGGVWAGGTGISSLTIIGGTNAPSTAGTEGSVSAETDTGHTTSPVNGSFTMNPDGSINTTLWTDFASRAMHEMAVKTKALAAAFYGKQQKFAYWDGCSTGGRQGHMEAQANPTDFDGILAGAPAFNWTKFINNELYPEVVMNIDLAGVPLTFAQLSLASSAAVSACDTALTGAHDGYISDPSACNYDPTTDPAVLCVGAGVGTNATASCLSLRQAGVMNKIWYGQTADGTVPAPSADNGFNVNRPSNQLWYGLTRGTFLAALAGSTPAGAFSPFFIAADQVAVNLQDPTYATPSFTNAVGNGANKWLTLNYLGLANAFAQGVALNPLFGNINTDNPDLSGFRDHGGKLLHYHGLSDILIMPEGSINYYTRMANQMGGFVAAQKFDRLFLIPGMGHCAGVGSVNGVAGVSPAANPPLPAPNQLFTALTNWVENGVAPTTIPVTTADGTISRPLCMYPTKLTYVGGSVSSASSFTCK